MHPLLKQIRKMRKECRAALDQGQRVEFELATLEAHVKDYIETTKKKGKRIKGGETV